MEMTLSKILTMSLSKIWSCFHWRVFLYTLKTNYLQIQINLCLLPVKFLKQPALQMEACERAISKIMKTLIQTAKEKLKLLIPLKLKLKWLIPHLLGAIKIQFQQSQDLSNVCLQRVEKTGTNEIIMVKFVENPDLGFEGIYKEDLINSDRFLHSNAHELN